VYVVIAPSDLAWCTGLIITRSSQARRYHALSQPLCADGARLARLACCLSKGHRSRLLLLTFYFGEPASDMGMHRSERLCLVKGGGRFGKCSRH
jgi:hypothetical protein